MASTAEFSIKIMFKGVRKERIASLYGYTTLTAAMTFAKILTDDTFIEAIWVERTWKESKRGRWQNTKWPVKGEVQR